jgi:hypothetical protein
MTQPKSKTSSKSKSKKSTTAATSKKVKRNLSAKSVEVDVTPAPIFDTAPVATLAPSVAVEPLPAPAPTRLVSRAEFMDLVRKEAYRRATRRNFKNGSAFQDWLHAEAAVSGKLAAEGARLS